MAMIKCPECGKDVSDKAASCIHCGSPIRVDKSVKIKMPYDRTGALGNKACEAELHCEGKTLWSGITGGVANFEIQSESATANLLIKKAYTGGLSFKDFTISGTVRQGKRYEVKMTRNAILGDPTKAEWVFSEIDVIDSGI